MIRQLALLAICAVAVSCAAPGGLGTHQADLAEGTFILISDRSDSRRCYTRIVGGAVRDQVCQQDAFLHYSPDPPPDQLDAIEVPGYVLALFTAMPDLEAEAAEGRARPAGTAAHSITTGTPSTR